MASWKGQPDLLAEFHDSDGKLIDSNIIDPILERNYEFLKNFFEEILSIFPEKFIHLGGDEVNFWLECWKTNPKIKEFMKQENMTDVKELENYYYNKLQNIMLELFANDTTRKMVFWQEIFNSNKPPPNTIAHLWDYKTKEELESATAHFTSLGYEVIVSSYWYLNKVKRRRDYDEYYECFPRNFDGTDEQKKLVIGGIACVWGEYINSANVETVLWPRACSVSERLWSNAKDTQSADIAYPRLNEQSCRLTQRGFRIAPLAGPGFSPIEFEDAYPPFSKN